VLVLGYRRLFPCRRERNVLSETKFRQIYFRDLTTGLGLLEDGTLVRFSYENRPGEGSANAFRVFEVEVVDERSKPLRPAVSTT
jgi:hypothetical protein